MRDLVQLFTEAWDL